MCGQIVVADVDGAIVERRCNTRDHAPGEPVPWEGKPVANPALLGSYVEVAPYGYRGRVTQIHHWCPQDEDWLAQQSDRSVVARKDELWVSVLVHEGGAVSAPMANARVVPAFHFANPYAGYYFGEARHG